MPLITTPKQLNQRAELYHQLGVMTTAGLSIHKALEHLQSNPPSLALRAPISQLLANLAEGHTVDAFPVAKVVDTTGAGDQYAAGFMLGLARGKPLDVCGRLGGLAAAEVISHYGPRPQVSLAELAAANGLA